jgi:hypothetical protein
MQITLNPGVNNSHGIDPALVALMGFCAGVCVSTPPIVDAHFGDDVNTIEANLGDGHYLPIAKTSDLEAAFDYVGKHCGLTPVERRELKSEAFHALRKGEMNERNTC